MATRQAKDVPVDRRIVGPDGKLTEAWGRHLELTADAMKRLEQEVDALDALAGSATLANVITQLNALVAGLQRALK